MPLAGVSHVALTVTDLERSKAWYGRVLEWSPVFEGDGEGVRFAVGTAPGGLMIGLREYEDGERGGFQPFRVGLDHLAFTVPADELPGWDQRLTDLGVVHDAPQDTPFGTVLNLKDPDGIALELAAPRS
jgi:catechol 2,3-dioxygenase-like lactoylglutathione lyase family enzyme